MKTIVDKKTLKNVWQLDKWYDKTFYVIGIITVTLNALAFILGFIQGFFGL